ncbi:efflux RND transporter periplasmic adaptor subunit [Lignipirellula cremea]|uniref:HlyD family secretion protein n=1 Tax=Lignipirellula cremea TaxID=2528010 RepID=A0A518DW94_9BACT|nr:efflux RND transporter periplasmic adaptor subunit [Lignipirellula cremea]QDU96104.1 HlyD family secretion protein [Lignipirellula cremea]
MIVPQQEQIRQVVQEIVGLVKSEADPEIFYPQFLALATSAIRGEYGVFWVFQDDGTVAPAYERGDFKATEDESFRKSRAELLQAVTTRGEPLGAALKSDASQTGSLLAAPMMHDGACRGVVEVLVGPAPPSDDSPDYLRFLSRVTDMAGEWYRTRQVRQIQKSQESWSDRQQFVELVHQSIDSNLTAYTLANEARRLIGASRVSVTLNHGTGMRVAAVSGQDEIDRRSNVATRLAALAKCVTAAGEPLWYRGEFDNLPPQIETALQEALTEALDVYSDETSSKTVIVIPLRRPAPPREQGRPNEEEPPELDQGEIFGALVVEDEAVLNDPQTTAQIEFVARQGALALANALEHSRLFLLPVWRALGNASWLIKAKTLPKTIAASTAVLAAILILWLVPADFNLEARGALQPVEKRELFAQTDGVVNSLHVKTGDYVTQGQLLLELDNPDLLLEEERLLGESQSSEQELQSIHRELLRRGLSDDDRHRLSSEQSRARSHQEHANTQLALVRKKINSLRLVSPAAGQIVTWDVVRLLDGRPVAAGQRLLTIADAKKPWRLELLMPEKRIGHVARAQREQEADAPLRVDYVLSSDPSTRRTGTVKEIEPVAAMYPEVGHAVKVRVEIDVNGSPRPIENPRPGASVTAEVYCGRRSLGYVLFHEMLEWVQENVLF